MGKPASRLTSLGAFIQENAFGNVVCEMSAILGRPQCVEGPVNTEMVSMACHLHEGMDLHWLSCVRILGTGGTISASRNVAPCGLRETLSWLLIKTGPALITPINWFHRRGGPPSPENAPISPTRLSVALYDRQRNSAQRPCLIFDGSPWNTICGDGYITRRSVTS